LDQPVRPRKEEESDYEDLGADPEDEVSEGEQGSEPDDPSTDENSSKDDESETSHDSDTSPEDEPEEHTDLKEISFGALAQAQAALGPVSRKRKLAEASASAEEIREKSWKNDDRKPKENTSRTSKHAPAIQSSRRAVSRRLEVFDPSPSLKSRDPRFDPLVQSSNADPNASSKANKNYSFLTSYQADEVLALKSQIKKSKTPDDAAALKRQLMSLESKLRRAEALNREKEVLRKYKQEERQAIKSGAKEKPYFLKKSDVKKEVLTQRFEGMSKKARDKAVERKRKRVKGKESRDMPWLRRERPTD
jgi:ribosomal RNA-processing protein 36